jgi:hypothetical protein
LIDQAVQQVQTAKRQAEGIIKSPENRSLLAFDFAGLTHKFAACKSQFELEQARLSALEDRLKEALEWAKAMADVIPSAELSARLKMLLADAQGPWREEPKTEIATGALRGPLEAPVAAAEHSAVEPGNPRKSGRIALEGLSAAAQRIVRLVRAGAPEESVLANVRSSRLPFHLSADDLIVLHQLGVPSPVQAAMLNQDGGIRKQGGISNESQP